MQKFLSDIPESTKLIISSILPLVIVVILFVFVGQFGISKVTDVRDQIAKSEKDQTTLTQKLTFLQSVSDNVKENAGLSLSALPDANPSLIILPQLKSASVNNGMFLSGVKSGAAIAGESGLSHVDISFQVSGTRSQISAFLKGISQIAPITIVDNIKITESAGVARADVTIKSYWSALPKTLPTTTTPITDLTAAEKKILTSISSLIQPVVVEAPVSSESGKIDPFSK